MNKPGPGRRIQSLGELSQDAAPSQDLWPAIESRLVSRRSSWTVPASLAATALIAALGWLMVHRTNGIGPQQLAQSGSGSLIRAALMSDPVYQSRREELLRGVDEKLKNLPQESQRRVRDSLQAVQTAMQTIEKELGRNSGNVLLQELLISSCQEEMRVLTAVNAIDGTKQEI
jgi:hypothetical protein